MHGLFSEGVAGITSCGRADSTAAEAPTLRCRCTGEGVLRQLEFTCSEPCVLPPESDRALHNSPDFSEETLWFWERGKEGERPLLRGACVFIS